MMTSVTLRCLFRWLKQLKKYLLQIYIGIGTTAGIGYGGIAIVDDDVIISTSSDVSADLIKANSNDLYMRQKSGIEKTLRIFIYYLNDNFDRIKSLNNVNVYYK